MRIAERRKTSTLRLLIQGTGFLGESGLEEVPHAWGNPTDTPIRLMITATPGGCEEALRLIATGGDQPNLQAIAEKFAVTVVGPPLLQG